MKKILEAKKECQRFLDRVDKLELRREKKYLILLFLIRECGAIKRSAMNLKMVLTEMTKS